VLGHVNNFEQKKAGKRLRKVPEPKKRYLWPLMTRCSRALKSSHMQLRCKCSFLSREWNPKKC